LLAPHKHPSGARGWKPPARGKLCAGSYIGGQ